MIDEQVSCIPVEPIETLKKNPTKQVVEHAEETKLYIEKSVNDQAEDPMSESDLFYECLDVPAQDAVQEEPIDDQYCDTASDRGDEFHDCLDEPSEANQSDQGYEGGNSHEARYNNG
jgi:hypothetical protein